MQMCAVWGCERATKIKLKATAQLCAWWERGLFKYWSSHWAQFHLRRAEEVNECISATVFFNVAFTPRRWRIENVSEIFILGADRLGLFDQKTLPCWS